MAGGFGRRRRVLGLRQRGRGQQGCQARSRQQSHATILRATRMVVNPGHPSPSSVLFMELSMCQFSTRKFTGWLSSKFLLANQPETCQPPPIPIGVAVERSEEHTSELKSLMRISYAV